jgi:hypothetical protein
LIGFIIDYLKFSDFDYKNYIFTGVTSLYGGMTITYIFTGVTSLYGGMTIT